MINSKKETKNCRLKKKKHEGGQAINRIKN